MGYIPPFYRDKSITLFIFKIANRKMHLPRKALPSKQNKEKERIDMNKVTKSLNKILELAAADLLIIDYFMDKKVDYREQTNL